MPCTEKASPRALLATQCFCATYQPQKATLAAPAASSAGVASTTAASCAPLARKTFTIHRSDQISHWNFQQSRNLEEELLEFAPSSLQISNARGEVTACP